MALDRCRIGIIIVGFRNPEDVRACLAALSRSAVEPRFDVFICENGGDGAFALLCETLIGPAGPCARGSDAPPEAPAAVSSGQIEIARFALKGRNTRVWVGCATQNLGYAGGTNVWIHRVLPNPEWDGVWVLNPDSEPEPNALKALVERSSAGNKGMVGSTIVPDVHCATVYCRAGHRWRRLRADLALIGHGEPVYAPVDLKSIEADLDCISGGSMYVTRRCLEDIGPMDERFFLFYEDADWSERAKKHGLGYAPDSIVPHKGGTTIGSARRRAERSYLSVYLESRNNLTFVRMHWPRYVLLAGLFGCIQAMMYLFARSPRNFQAAAKGLLAGIRGETGQPRFHDR
ncbi:glycosyltransferase family 2 protein [Bradyrhizobium sp. WSM471]|uniref:glycosyltransferase family 2 protein n=1 Tax=Bradyrhizobium sp. WSM471 TaxID=319017 RepID=UPI00024D21CD|nr:MULTISPECIES: glycosyltransferase family 2 protein [Bradyrhizobium]EHR01348.1 putative glycosyltransferase [Bradyrhizobium sp. WSM471]UFW43410.1 glycosyltransferase family 2 protein [Bradyrhizobium canariense]